MFGFEIASKHGQCHPKFKLVPHHVSCDGFGCPRFLLEGYNSLPGGTEMRKTYVVTLSSEERSSLEKLVSTGRASAKRQTPQTPANPGGDYVPRPWISPHSPEPP